MCSSVPGQKIVADACRVMNPNPNDPAICDLGVPSGPDGSRHEKSSFLAFRPRKTTQTDQNKKAQPLTDPAAGNSTQQSAVHIASAAAGYLCVAPAGRPLEQNLQGQEDMP